MNQISTQRPEPEELEELDEFDDDEIPVKPEELTDRQRAELEASEKAMQALIGTQRPVPETAINDETKFNRFIDEIWGLGWKTGYYSKPDKPCACPYNDQRSKEVWIQGVLAGAEAREILEPDKAA